eukprot:jgi/Mesvir1/487/Mv11359-RA.1
MRKRVVAGTLCVLVALVAIASVLRGEIHADSHFEYERGRHLPDEHRYSNVVVGSSHHTIHAATSYAASGGGPPGQQTSAVGEADAGGSSDSALPRGGQQPLLATSSAASLGVTQTGPVGITSPPSAKHPRSTGTEQAPGSSIFGHGEEEQPRDRRSDLDRTSGELPGSVVLPVRSGAADVRSPSAVLPRLVADGSSITGTSGAAPPQGTPTPGVTTVGPLVSTGIMSAAPVAAMDIAGTASPVGSHATGSAPLVVVTDAAATSSSLDPLPATSSPFPPGRTGSGSSRYRPAAGEGLRPSQVAGTSSSSSSSSSSSNNNNKSNDSGGSSNSSSINNNDSSSRSSRSSIPVSSSTPDVGSREGNNLDNAQKGGVPDQAQPANIHRLATPDPVSRMAATTASDGNPAAGSGLIPVDTQPEAGSSTGSGAVAAGSAMVPTGGVTIEDAAGDADVSIGEPAGGDASSGEPAGGDASSGESAGGDASSGESAGEALLEDGQGSGASLATPLGSLSGADASHSDGMVGSLAVAGVSERAAAGSEGATGDAAAADDDDDEWSGQKMGKDEGGEGNLIGHTPLRAVQGGDGDGEGSDPSDRMLTDDGTEVEGEAREEDEGGVAEGDIRASKIKELDDEAVEGGIIEDVGMGGGGKGEDEEGIATPNMGDGVASSRAGGEGTTTEDKDKGVSEEGQGGTLEEVPKSGVPGHLASENAASEDPSALLDKATMDSSTPPTLSPLAESVPRFTAHKGGKRHAGGRHGKGKHKAKGGVPAAASSSSSAEAVQSAAIAALKASPSMTSSSLVVSATSLMSSSSGAISAGPQVTVSSQAAGAAGAELNAAAVESAAQAAVEVHLPPHSPMVISRGSLEQPPWDGEVLATRVQEEGEGQPGGASGSKGGGAAKGAVVAGRKDRENAVDPDRGLEEGEDDAGGNESVSVPLPSTASSREADAAGSELEADGVGVGEGNGGDVGKAKGGQAANDGEGEEAGAVRIKVTQEEEGDDGVQGALSKKARKAVYGKAVASSVVPGARSSNRARHWVRRIAKKGVGLPDDMFPTNDTGGGTFGTPADDRSGGESICSDGRCRPHGFCRAGTGTCVCAAAYKGELCDQTKDFPPGTLPEFHGHFLMNRAHLAQIKSSTGNIKYTSNPKKSGGTHTINIPISDALLHSAPVHDPLQENLYDTCAVVGNSGILTKFALGREIDAHDLVIRFNVAPTDESVEKFVGKRTHLRLLNTFHAGFREHNEIGIQQLQSVTGADLYVKIKLLFPKIKHYAFDPDFSMFVSKNIHTLPTGGFFAVMLALQKCARVDLYGFHFRKGWGITHHYFNVEKPLKGKRAIHDYDAEAEVMKKLAQMHLLHFAEPCALGCEKDSGLRCDNCPVGTVCECNSYNPLPVALPGYCRADGDEHCFHKCIQGRSVCPGGARGENLPSCLRKAVPAGAKLLCTLPRSF